jgi:glutamyl-Q tRNA(Asp) synthetase
VPGEATAPEPRRHVGGYVGRFAPSPTGPLHAGSLVAALASWLDARAWNNGVGGRWLVRIEDLDTPRNMAGATETLLHQLADCALLPDESPIYQSRRLDRYAQALQQLIARSLAYPCGCSRKDITLALQGQGVTLQRHQERVYPGTCRNGLQGKTALAWRLRIDRADANADADADADSGSNGHSTEPAGPDAPRIDGTNVFWTDRCLGTQQQDVASAVGDFVLKRADGPFAYQLAVVVDDAAQHVSHVVRGADLADNTARQILLQRALGLPTPRYLHTPLVLAADGSKLSKQNGASAIDTRAPLQALQHAAAVLGLPSQAGPVADALSGWVAAWRGLYNPAP